MKRIQLCTLSLVSVTILAHVWMPTEATHASHPAPSESALEVKLAAIAVQFNEAIQVVPNGVKAVEAARQERRAGLLGQRKRAIDAFRVLAGTSSTSSLTGDDALMSLGRGIDHFQMIQMASAQTDAKMKFINLSGKNRANLALVIERFDSDDPFGSPDVDQFLFKLGLVNNEMMLNFGHQRELEDGGLQ